MLFLTFALRADHEEIHQHKYAHEGEYLQNRIRAAAAAASAAWALAIKKDIEQFQQLFGAADSTSFAVQDNFISGQCGWLRQLWFDVPTGSRGRVCGRCWGKTGPAFKGIGKAGSIGKIQCGRDAVDTEFLMDEVVNGVVETHLIAQIGEVNGVLLKPPLQRALGQVQIIGNFTNAQAQSTYSALQHFEYSGRYTVYLRKGADCWYSSNVLTIPPAPMPWSCMRR